LLGPHPPTPHSPIPNPHKLNEIILIIKNKIFLYK